MLDVTLDAASNGLSDARSKIEATRAALQAALDALDGQDAQEFDLAPIHELVMRLDWIVAQMARVQGIVEKRVVKVN